MKKKLSFLFLMVMLVALIAALGACGGPKHYTVTFDADGGSAVAKQTVRVGEKAIEPEYPTLEGYEFDGWYLGDNRYKFDEPVTGDITLQARWDVKTCTVRFDTDGGTELADISVEYGSTLATEETLKFGYEFGGWVDTATNEAFAEGGVVRSDMTLKAQWKTTDAFDDIYGVWVDSGDFRLTVNNTLSAKISYLSGGKTVSLTFDKILTRATDTVILCSDSGDRYELNFNGENLTVPTGPWGTGATLSPASTITVTYHYDDESGERVQVAKGETFVVLPGDAPEGYELDGWYDKDLKIYTKETVINEAIDVYAHYVMSGFAIEDGKVISYFGDAEHVVIPTYYGGMTVTGIEQLAFFNNLTMRSLEIPEGITTIESLAFSFTSLTSIVLPKSLKYLGEMAFYGCNDMLSATFLSEVPCIIGNYPFTVADDDAVYMSGLLIYVPDTKLDPYKMYRADIYLREYASSIFPVTYSGAYGYIVKDGIMLGYARDPNSAEYPTTVEVPKGVSELADFAFYNNNTVKSLVMPEGFKKIGKYAFYNCTTISRLYMPSTMEEIDDYAFTGFFVGNEITRLYFPEGFKRIGEGVFMTGFNLRIVSLPSTIEYIGYLAFGASSKLERMYFNSTTPPAVGSATFDDRTATDIFAYVNVGKTVIYVPYGYYTEGANAGRSYAEVYKSTAGFESVVDYIRPRPEGPEVGHYGDGEVFLDLDGCDLATIKVGSREEQGKYVITGKNISFEFPTFGSIVGTFNKRTVSLTLQGKSHILEEPEYYYDSYNWSNFVLYPNGTGMFDMAGGYYLTPFKWEIKDSSFMMEIDGNNVAPENEVYFGEFLYTGVYHADTKQIEISFMLNDYFMTYTADKIERRYATGESERLLGTYVARAESNPDYIMFKFEFYGDGTVDLAIGGGANTYKGLTYTIDGNTVTINVMSYLVTLEITKDGDLYGDFGGTGDMVYMYEDVITDPSTM